MARHPAAFALTAAFSVCLQWPLVTEELGLVHAAHLGSHGFLCVLLLRATTEGEKANSDELHTTVQKLDKRHCRRAATRARMKIIQIFHPDNHGNTDSRPFSVEVEVPFQQT